MKSDKGVTIYCINETEDENEDTQVTKVSEPKTDDKITENIEPVVTEAVEAPRATQTTETKKPRYEHRESSEIVAEDAVPRKITEETGLTENTGISKAILVDPTEDTKTDVSEQTVAEQVEVTHTIDIAELVTGIPEPTLDEESTTTLPGFTPEKKPQDPKQEQRQHGSECRTSSQKDTQIPRNKQFHCK